MNEERDPPLSLSLPVLHVLCCVMRSLVYILMFLAYTLSSNEMILFGFIQRSIIATKHKIKIIICT